VIVERVVEELCHEVSIAAYTVNTVYAVCWLACAQKPKDGLQIRALPDPGPCTVAVMAVPDDPDGPVVSDTWVTSEKAVNAFEAFCLDQGWVFTETSEQTDFGKDGYLDFSKEGRLTGQCIALQIKGGVSFHRRDSYVIPADRRRRTFWRESSIPVFGIVWDPAGGGLYWTDLTGTLRNEGLDATLQIPATTPTYRKRQRMTASASGEPTRRTSFSCAESCSGSTQPRSTRRFRPSITARTTAITPTGRTG
jgi:hypothetical protein